MGKGWGPGTRERQYASRDTIPQHWGERTHSRTQAQLRLYRSSPAAAELLLPTQGSGVHTSFYIGLVLHWRRTPDPSSRPSDPFLPFLSRESTPDPRNRKTALTPDPRASGREVKRAAPMNNVKY